MATDLAETSDIKVLASGRLVEVDPITRKATPWLCPWSIEVLSGNPEPDFPSDCYVTIDCSAPVYALGDEGGWSCGGGHHHYPYGSEAQQAEEAAEAFR